MQDVIPESIMGCLVCACIDEDVGEGGSLE
jgi:hypothetical protein